MWQGTTSVFTLVRDTYKVQVLSFLQKYHLYHLTLLLLRNKRTAIWKVDLGQLALFQVTDLAVHRVSLCILLASQLVKGAVVIVPNLAVVLMTIGKVDANQVVEAAVIVVKKLTAFYATPSMYSLSILSTIQ